MKINISAMKYNGGEKEEGKIREEEGIHSI